MILEELKTLLSNLNIPVETGEFNEKPPDKYCVLTPLSDRFDLFGDNLPTLDIQEVRISFFGKGNYLSIQKRVVQSLLQHEFTITERLFVGFEKETNYYHVAIDVAKHYEMEV